MLWAFSLRLFFSAFLFYFGFVFLRFLCVCFAFSLRFVFLSFFDVFLTFCDHFWPRKNGKPETDSKRCRAAQPKRKQNAFHVYFTFGLFFFYAQTWKKRPQRFPNVVGERNEHQKGEGPNVAERWQRFFNVWRRPLFRKRSENVHKTFGAFASLTEGSQRACARRRGWRASRPFPLRFLCVFFAFSLRFLCVWQIAKR